MEETSQAAAAAGNVMSRAFNFLVVLIRLFLRQLPPSPLLPASISRPLVRFRLKKATLHLIVYLVVHLLCFK